MAKEAKKDPNEFSVEEKLRALYQLQSMLSEIDKIKTLRGELPLEVQDLEDEVAGLGTRIEKIQKEIAELKSLWGQGIDEPYIALENVKVTANSITLMSPDKNPTLKITLPNGTTLIKFKSSQEEFESLKTDGLITINIVGRCERNVWNGRVNPQIILEDYEIANKVEYYF